VCVCARVYVCMAGYTSHGPASSTGVVMLRLEELEHVQHMYLKVEEHEAVGKSVSPCLYFL